MADKIIRSYKILCDVKGGKGRASKKRRVERAQEDDEDDTNDTVLRHGFINDLLIGASDLVSLGKRINIYPLALGVGRLQVAGYPTNSARRPPTRFAFLQNKNITNLSRLAQVTSLQRMPSHNVDRFQLTLSDGNQSMIASLGSNHSHVSGVPQKATPDPDTRPDTLPPPSP